MLKRISSLILGVICIFTCFVGCKDEETLEPARTKYRFTQGVHQLTAPETNDLMVENGKSDYKILMPADADSYLYVAESELKYFFEEATGVKLDTVFEPKEGFSHTPEGKFISLGETKMLASANVDLQTSKLGSQGVRIVTKDKTVYMTGSTSVGTLNSVYTLLQIMFDYEQYSYDCFTMNNSSVVRLRNFDVVDVPDIEMRGSSTTQMELNPNNVQYRMRTRSCADYFLPIGDTESGASTHVYHNAINVIPVEAETTRENWLSNQCGEGEGNCQICYTARGNQEDYKALVERITYVVSRSLIQYNPKDYPLRNIVAFTHEDNDQVMCRCESCIAAEKKYGTQSGAAIVLSNAIAESLQAWMNLPENAAYKRENLKVAFFAYRAFVTAPAHYDEAKGKYVINHPDLQMRDDVGVFYAVSDGLSYQQNLYSQTSEEGLQNSLKWFDISPSVYLWTYNANFGNFMFRTAGTNFYDTDAYQFFAAGGADLLFQQGAMPTDNVTSFQLLDAYLDAKMQWDTTQDIDELTKKWFKAMYKDASDVMFDLYVKQNTWATIIAYETKKIVQPGIINYSVGREYMKYEMLRDWLEMIDQARALIAKYETSNPGLYRMLKEHIDVEWVCPAYYMIEFNAQNLSDEKYNEIVKYFKTDISGLRDFRLSEKSTITINMWTAELSLR
ncbi:MAG: DUF4838 domain-containing protein [Clostridia bacterium]|nr:DUF4838 domain-containing protein [Clostridia bacterium]